jgi:hypothetical protein
MGVARIPNVVSERLDHEDIITQQIGHPEAASSTPQFVQEELRQEGPADGRVGLCAASAGTVSID